MRKKLLKIIIFSFLLNFLLIGFVFAQRELEVKYPEIFGYAPKTVEQTLLPDYIKYIFNFIISLAGIIALGALIYGGVQYLTSTGQPEKLKTARNQILTALLGVVILLSAYLILTTVNPQLIIFKMPFLEEIIFPAPATAPSPAPPVYENYLWRITEIADSVKGITGNEKDGIKKTAQDIKSLTSKCNCQNTQPMCLCENYTGGGCRALYCYSAEITQPCPDSTEIKEKQQNLIASLFEILYYRNRATTEREDFLIEIENLKKEISYYEEKIKQEKEYLAKIEGDYARKEQEKLIQNLEETKTKLINRLGLYEELEKELKGLVSSIDETALPTDELSELPDECLANVKEKCRGSCSGGCHDTKGCFPGQCSGGNPCPVNEIDNKVSEIESLTETIKNISDKIIETIIKIIRL